MSKIYLLPTRGNRRYRGKYPNNINMWSMSDSPSQRALGKYLGLQRPVHVELNDGRRYILNYFDLSAYKTKIGADFDKVRLNCTEIEELPQSRYDEMLGLVREARAAE